MHDSSSPKAKRITDAMPSLPRDQFIEMSDPSLVLGRSIPLTNAVSEILTHLDVQPEHKILQVGAGAGYVAALVDFSRDTGMTLLDMGMVSQGMLSDARSISKEKNTFYQGVTRQT